MFNDLIIRFQGIMFLPYDTVYMYIAEGTPKLRDLITVAYLVILKLVD